MISSETDNSGTRETVASSDEASTRSAESPADQLGRPARVVERMVRSVKLVLPPLLLVAALVGVWQWYVVVGNVRPTTLPSPGRVVVQGWRYRSLIWENTIPTLKETFLGFAVSVLIGSLFAVVIDFSSSVRRALYPVLVSSQTLPIIAIAPLMIIWFGFGLLPKVLVVILTTFFPITIGLIDGFNSTESEAMNLLGSMGANKIRIFRYVRLPSAMPSFFSGLRIGITYAVVGAVFAEYVGARKGLGIFMLVQKNSFRTDLVLAAVFVTALVSVSLFSLVSVLQRLTIPWYAASRRQRQDA